MKILKTALLLLVTAGFTYAQNCTAYLPYEEGTKLQMKSYDKKGKHTGTTNQELVKVENAGNTTTYTLHQDYLDSKGNDEVSSDLQFKCVDNVFYIDMNVFINSEQMAAYEDMDMQIEMDDVEIPGNLKAGQELKDGKITMKLTTDSPIAMNFFVEIKNRKVEAVEKITTPAGEFECAKISQDIISKFGFSITMSSIDWYAEGIGSVRNETYRKGKLMGYTELTKIEKP